MVKLYIHKLDRRCNKMDPKLRNKRGIPFPTHIVYSMISLIVQIMVFASTYNGICHICFVLE